MQVLVLGTGLVGRELARSLRADGHRVVGTTTTPDRRTDLLDDCDEVHVLRGSDTVAVEAALEGCDAVAVCAGPNAQRAMTPQERAQTYEEVLVETARSVVAACSRRLPEGPVVVLSSLSVYGDDAGATGVTEASPTTRHTDPSPTSFLAMERTYLDGLPDQACVLRCADIYGAEDPPIEDKVAMAHQYLGGSVPFSADALFYRVHVLDVVAAVRHVFDERLTGVHNLTHAEVPATNTERFDAISAALGKPPLTYRGELRGPVGPVSTEKLRSTGFSTTHTRAETSQ